MNDAPFTGKLMKWMLIFVVSLAASYLAISSRGLLPRNIMRATLAQTVIYCVLGLVSVGVLLLTIIAGLFVFGLLLQAYEIGAKVLNGTHDIERKRPSDL